MAVLIIFPIILQTVINLRMLSIGEQGETQTVQCTIITINQAIQDF